MARTKLSFRLEKERKSEIRTENSGQIRKDRPSPGGIKWPKPKHIKIRISDRIRIRRTFIFDKIKCKYIKFSSVSE